MRALAILAILAGCDRFFGLDRATPGDAAVVADVAPEVDVPEIDTDGDGVFDGLDNCPITPNSNQLNFDGDAFGDACDSCPAVVDDQHDEDADGVADSCDNCPNLPNADQTDTDHDGLGDVCDGDNGTHDCLVFFDSFHRTPSDWTDPRGTWVIDNDAMTQVEPGVSQGILLAPGNYTNPVIATHATITGGGPHGGNIGVWVGATVNGNPLPDGYLAEIFDPIAPGNGPVFGVSSTANNMGTALQNYLPLTSPTDFSPDSRVELVFETRAAPAYLFVAKHIAATQTVGTGSMSGGNGPPSSSAGRVGLRINTLTARFDFFMVVTRQSTCPVPIIR